MLAQKRYSILIALGVMVLLQMACGQTSPTADEKKIATTVANQVRATLTAEAQKPAAATAVAAAPSDTPEPTKTPAPTATSSPTKTPAPTATDTPTSLPTATPVPTDTSAPAVTPTATETPPAGDAPTSDLIVNAPAMLGARVAEVEGVLGKPLDVVQIGRGSVEAIPEGGESRTYEIQKYLLYVDYDKTGIAKGVQLFSGLEKHGYALSAWPVALRRVGVDFITKPPDVSASIAVAWTNVNGYAVRVETDAIGGKIWSVWVSLVSANPRPANTPDKPAAIASSASNIRSGPGTSYPIVGKASAGQRYDILGRNADSSWWQISYGGKQGWIAASVVKASGPLTQVAVAQNIPTPPPAPTPPPVKPTSPPAKPPSLPLTRPDQEFMVKNWGLRLYDVKRAKSVYFYGDARFAQGTYLIPLVEFRNTSSGTATPLRTLNFYLQDTRGRTYKFDPFDEAVLGAAWQFQAGHLYDDINPGLTLGIALPFDVSPDLTDVWLRVKEDSKIVMYLGNVSQLPESR